MRDKHIVDDVLKERGFWDEEEIQRRAKIKEEGHCLCAYDEWKKEKK